MLVEGELQTQKWEKDGQLKSKVVVKVMKVQLVGGKKREEPEMAEAFATDFK